MLLEMACASCRDLEGKLSEFRRMQRCGKRTEET
jgi:hypothetical protein